VGIAIPCDAQDVQRRAPGESRFKRGGTINGDFAVLQGEWDLSCLCESLAYPLVGIRPKRGDN